MGQKHGNCKLPYGSPFVRTPLEIMQSAGELVTKMPVKVAYDKMITENDCDVAPRDSKVLRNKKYNVLKSQRGTSAAVPCANFADEWQAVYYQLHHQMQTGNTIRLLISSPNRVPNIIMYTDRQLFEIKSFCFNGQNGSVLGFDRTFNLGKIYVTASNYKNLALQRKRDSGCPIFLGPLLIHGNADTETYGLLFGHLAGKFIDCDQNMLILGSDDEQAMRKAMISFFPSAQTVACSKHLRDNFIRKIDELLGKGTVENKALSLAICQLMDCTDAISFEASLQHLHLHALSNAPAEFNTYFESRLHLLRSNAATHMNTWTNNNSESINHILKQYIHWNPQSLPQLVDKLRQLLVAQQVEADRALIGRGDLMLQPQYVGHRITLEKWKSMTEKQRMAASAACFRLPSTRPSAVSTDGFLSVPLTPGAGKKPHQKKRVRNERATTKPKNKRPRCLNELD